MRLFALVFIISLLAISAVFFIKGLITAILFSVVILLLWWITKGIWLPESKGPFSVMLGSLSFALAAIGSSPIWKEIVNTFVVGLLKNKYPEISNNSLVQNSPSAILLIFVLSVIFIVNYFSQSKTLVKPYSKSADKEFPPKDYKKRLEGFCRVLLNDLNKIDHETHWSTEYFIPLNAEVEVRTISRQKRKVMDLLNAIRTNKKSRVFLVLGDPGSGKSIALRKLCRELLNEVKKTGIVPIYINLREWEIDQKWTENNRPSVPQLYEFVIKNLKERGDIFSNDFIDSYFKKMFDNGRLFLIFDSFDEIPDVLDEDESSWLINELSAVIFNFLSGAHESGGILASRFFRRPSFAFKADTILDIRPLSEDKIVQILKNSPYYNKSLLRQLFKERQELIPSARNPFTASLISNYAKEHNNFLPKSHAELYENHIQRRLEDIKNIIKKKDLTVKKVVECLVEIADFMYKVPGFGLEAPVEKISEILPKYSVKDVIWITKYAKLGRIGSGEEQRFCFAHRRFHEYFIAMRMKKSPTNISLVTIPTDSRWRDALVMYCEISAEKSARKIANFCWDEIHEYQEEKKEGRSTYNKRLRAIHCLRFLKDAFRSRLKCLASFRNGLLVAIKDQIEDEDILAAKIAVEAVGLIDEREIDEVIILALNRQNPWISQTAIRSCRHLPRLSNNLERRLVKYIYTLQTNELIGRRKELLFSFSLSDGFFKLRRYFLLRLFDLCLVSLSLIFVGLINVIYAFVYLLFLFIDQLMVNRPRFFQALRVNMALLMLVTIYSQGIAYMTGLAPQLFGEVAPLKLILLAISIFFILPFTSFFLFIQSHKLKKALIMIWRGIFRFIIVSVPLFLVMFLIVTYVNILLYIIAAIMLIVFAIFLYAEVLPGLIKYIKDIKFLKSISIRQKMDKQNISEYFSSFRTDRMRFKFVLRLQNNRVQANGEWPGGVLPNIRNDKASILLAQLEETWLGLDR